MTGMLDQGARNLLLNCGQVKAGEKVLIVREDPALGWYDDGAPDAIAALANDTGAEVTEVRVGAPTNESNDDINRLSGEHDCTVFFARIGDQERFAEPPKGTRVVMSYIRDAEMLASAYGTGDYDTFVAIKSAINNLLLGASEIAITCPLGSRVTGRASESDVAERADVTVRRFPLGIHQPLSATTFSGMVVLARYLTPTGSKVYEPPFLQIGNPVHAHFEDGRIVRFDGDDSEVGAIVRHYRTVSNLLDLDPDNIHSWHAGIHPGNVYKPDVSEDPDRWSNSAFTHPRWLHFHTCGSYPPGEICWMVKDPTISVDGLPLWQDGHLQPDSFPTLQGILATQPEIREMFDNPSNFIGVNEE